MERKKVLGFWDLVLFSFCAIFGLEAIATSAAIGPSAISWWLICIVGYFLPFGLIAAELGSTYPEQGGIYVWIKRAWGKKWAGRSIWYYWISLPIWLPAIYIAIADILGNMFFPGISLWGEISIGVILIWIAVLVNLCPLKISKWIPNIGSAAQFVIVGGMIISAVVYFLKNGHFANTIGIKDVVPNVNAAVVFIPVIIYNLMGCELISAAAGETKNPQRDIPRALIVSAIVIALLYLITTFSVWVVIPIKEINVASGILHIFTITFNDHSLKYTITVIFGLVISSAFFAGIVTWNLGQNRTVAESAHNGDLPKILGKMTPDMAPIGASIVSGIISTAVIIIYGLIAKNAAELFWHVISFSLVIGLFSYLMLFPSFIILRKKDKSINRPYRIPGPDWFAILLAIMAEAFVFIAVLILFIQPGHDFIRFALPIIIGVLVTVIIGEIFVARCMQKTMANK
ncbi:MAG TPA: APC family permease [Candidatus Omnitrophota bacterium]|nr:APC family permease [Candidatus Omnitrophota bacterium]HPD85388.1 APC family permease [Candidatus Omnitrophota bacterium]HRZ04111.1 APC family permease [Candidatus Omnitrophota bacterium]